MNEGQGRKEGTLTKIRDVYVEINGKYDRRNIILRRDILDERQEWRMFRKEPRTEG